MFHPDRVSTLSSMSNPRRPHRLPLDAGVSKAAWAANDELAEQRILEIAELAFILEVDGFPVPEIFRRVGLVHPPMPPLDRLCPFGNPLHDCVVENLRAHSPTYLKLGTENLNQALALAELWALLAAERRRQQNWPPQEMLEPPGRLAYLVRDDDEDDEIDKLALRGDAIEILDALLAKVRFPACPDLRRLRARAVSGDKLRNYSTGTQSFLFMMGSAGLALLRSGHVIDYVELMKN